MGINVNVEQQMFSCSYATHCPKTWNEKLGEFSVIHFYVRAYMHLIILFHKIHLKKRAYNFQLTRKLLVCSKLE